MRNIFKGSVAVLVGLLALAGCTGSNGGEAGSAATSPAPATSVAATDTATDEPSAEAEESPSESGSPSEEPSAEPSAPASEEAPPSATPPPPVEELPEATVFTTADGYYSFSMPSNWEAVAVQPPELPTYGMRISTTAYAISNSEGRQVAKFIGGIPGDGAVVPSPGHVPLDSAPTPLVDQSGLPVTFVFDHRPDDVTGNRLYEARLEPGPVPPNGVWGSPLGLVSYETNGGVVFTSSLEPGRFKTEAEARAWMDSAEYQQLKSMMVSFQLNP